MYIPDAANTAISTVSDAPPTARIAADAGGDAGPEEVSAGEQATTADAVTEAPDRERGHGLASVVPGVQHRRPRRGLGGGVGSRAQ